MLKINNITVFQRSMHFWIWCRLKYSFGSAHTEFTFSSVQAEHLLTVLTIASFWHKVASVSFQTFLLFIADSFAVLINR